MLEDVLNIDAISSLSPQTWFEQVGDAIAEKAGCGTAPPENNLDEGISGQAEESSIEVTATDLPESLGK